MTNGNILYARFPLDSDARAPADTVKIDPIPLIEFESIAFDHVECQVIQVGGNDGVFKNVVIIIGRNIA